MKYCYPRFNHHFPPYAQSMWKCMLLFLFFQNSYWLTNWSFNMFKSPQEQILNIPSRSKQMEMIWLFFLKIFVMFIFKYALTPIPVSKDLDIEVQLGECLEAFLTKVWSPMCNLLFIWTKNWSRLDKWLNFAMFIQGREIILRAM